MYSRIEGQGDLQKLGELAQVPNNLDVGDSIVVASSFSHMLNLGNLAKFKLLIIDGQRWQRKAI